MTNKSFHSYCSGFGTRITFNNNILLIYIVFHPVKLTKPFIVCLVTGINIKIVKSYNVFSGVPGFCRKIETFCLQQKFATDPFPSHKLMLANYNWSVFDWSSTATDLRNALTGRRRAAPRRPVSAARWRCGAAGRGRRGADVSRFDVATRRILAIIIHSRRAAAARVA